MTFSEYYKQIVNKKERSAFRDQIMQLTGIQFTTFYSWLNRGRIPQVYQKTISELTNKEITELFPETKNEVINH